MANTGELRMVKCTSDMSLCNVLSRVCYGAQYLSLTSPARLINSRGGKKKRNHIYIFFLPYSRQLGCYIMNGPDSSSGKDTEMILLIMENTDTTYVHHVRCMCIL